MSTVSVIIPTYNRARFLKTAVESVLHQTFQDFDISIVDDGSTDKTRQTVFAFNDKRIRYFRHPFNKGNAAARNTGIQNSTGKYVAFLDDDDEWLPDKLKQQVKLLNTTPENVGAVYTGFVTIDKRSSKTLSETSPSKRGSIFDDLLSANCVGTTSTVVLRRKCFQTVGLFDEELVAWVDYDMWLRVAKEFDFECLPSPQVKYYTHSGNITANYGAKIQGIKKMQQKHGALFALDRKSFSGQYLALGVSHCYDGDTKVGRQALRKAIKLYPFEIRHYYNLGLSLLGAKNFKLVKELSCRLRLRARQL
jgi:glycosyltransferase involved in cell wall biosynthesis